MKEIEESGENPEIKEVLKALNHAKRRDILIYLKDLERGTSFSELMEYLDIDSKTSSQFSYHLKLLLTAKLIEKNTISDKYSISNLGVKACSMLDMVDTTEKNESIVQKISLSYKNIKPIDQVVISFESFALVLFIMPITGIFNHTNLITLLFLPLIIGIALFVSITSYAYLKLKYLPSLLVLSSLIWVLFLPSNQIKCGVLYMASVLGAIFFYQGFLNFLLNQGNITFDLFGSLIFLTISLIVIVDILYEEYVKETPSIS